MKRLLVLVWLLVITGCIGTGCVGLKDWEVKTGWSKGTAGKTKTETVKTDKEAEGGKFDSDGNFVPDDPTVAATYSFPDVHAGFGYDAEYNRIRSMIGVEILEVKAPYVGWLNVDIGVAEDMVFLGLSKRWTSIYEVTSGLFIGYDFAGEYRGTDKDKEANPGITFGFFGTLTKF